MKGIYINPRQLNINTILKKHNPSLNNPPNNQFFNKDNKNNYLNSDITFINNILNNNSLKEQQSQKESQKQSHKESQKQSNSYNIVKYLGEGIQGSLYLANDLDKKRYICKKINIDKNNTNQIKQLELELNILKYLSSNKVTKKYINPCLDYKLIDNNVFTIFPVFDGYSLNHLTTYLKKLDNNSYYKIIFHLIKTILQGMANIHQSKIAHQNLNNNSILVSTYENPKEIKIKFTDFGLGCGHNNFNSKKQSNMINISEYTNKEHNENYNENYNEETNTIKSLFNFNSCKLHNFAPINLTENVISELVDLDYLLISQKYDLFCLGIIFIKLLLFFDNFDIDLSKGYNSKSKQEILSIIDEKYLLKSKDKKDYKNMFPFINVSNNVKQDIFEYLKLFKEFILCKTANRKSCQYVLDKIIIYEKYKGEVF